MSGEKNACRDVFDDLMVEIGARMFDLQALLARFVSELLSRHENLALPCDLNIPFRTNDRYENFHAEKILYDREQEKIFLLGAGNSAAVEWSSLGISVQEEIAGYLHMKYVSERRYKNLSSRDEIH